MGRMDFLQGGYEGKVGATYGVRQYAKPIVKAVPFSHAPQNQTQKNAFSAFGCLQRISSLIARDFFKYTGLSSKTQSKINAVSHWLKPLVSGGAFSFTKFRDIIPETGELTINAFEYREATNDFTLDYSTSFDGNKGTNPTIFFGVYDESGKGLASLVTTAQSGNVTIACEYENVLTANLVAFISYQKNKHWKQTGLAMHLDFGGVVINEIFYPNRMQNGVWSYIGNETVKGVGVVYDYENEKIIFG